MSPSSSTDLKNSLRRALLTLLILAFLDWKLINRTLKMPWVQAAIILMVMAIILIRVLQKPAAKNSDNDI